jgi:hypothetical protein
MLSFGIQSSHGPVRLPVNDDYGMLPRVCFPIRRDGTLSGYLWLFDEPPVSEEDMATTARTVAELAQILHRGDASLRERADLVRSLTIRATSRATAVAAVEQAVSLDLLPDDGNLTIHAIRLDPATSAAVSRPAGAAAKDTQLELSRPRPGRPYLLHYAPQRLIVITRNRTARDASTVLAGINRLMRTGGIKVDSAGSAQASSPLELETTLDRADFAASRAALLKSGPDPLAWEDTGTWRLLQGRALNEATVAELSEDAWKLLQRGAPEHWQTVLAYLDAGRSVQATSQALNIHRATLHYRLERIRDILGPSALDDGWQAASLHVALKLHQALHQGGRPVEKYLLPSYTGASE